MATIETRTTKEGETRYRVSVRRKGRPAERATFTRLTDAKKWARQTESAIEEGRHFRTAAGKKMTLGAVIDKYIAEVLPHKPRSRGQQEPQLQWWKDCIGGYALPDITPGLIGEQRAALMADKSPSTSNRYLAILSHVFTKCVREWGLLDLNPVQKIQRMPEPKGRVRFLSDDERKRLLDACRADRNPHLYDAVVLALSTGCRKNEVLHLRWTDVHLDRGQITLMDTKNSEARAVPLTGHALDRMQDRSRTRRADDVYVFQQDGQCKPADVDRDFARARGAAGIENFRFHDLRHSTASYLAMNGATLAEIAAVLGHKTLAMVKRYSHLSDAHTSAVVSRMTDKIFADEGGAR